MKNTCPGDDIWVKTEKGDNLIKLAAHPENENRGYLGLVPISAFSHWKFANPLFTMGVAMAELLGEPVFHPYIYDARIPWGAVDILKWMFVLNLGIGLFNLLPAVPLDGGYMMEAIVEHKSSKKKAKRVRRVLSYVVLVLILMNFIPALMR